MTSAFVRVEIKGVKEVIAFLGKMADKTHSIVENETFRIANEFRNRIINEMRNTPKNAARPYRRQKIGKFHYPSFPGNFPAIDYGNLIASIRVEKGEDGIYLGSVINEPKYPLFLDQALEASRRRPWLVEPVEKWSEQVNFEQRIIKRLKEELW